MVKNVITRTICLTATLRPCDVPDIMRRLSVDSMVVFRKSCFRTGLQFEVNSLLNSETDIVAAASSLAGTCAKDGKTLVFTTSVPLCDKIVDELKKEHQR